MHLPVVGKPLPQDPFCALCHAAPPSLLRCSRCKVVSYCSKEHQADHRATHKRVCNAIGCATAKTETEASRLRNNPGDWMTEAGNLFENSAGDFWGILATRDYMRARIALVKALVDVDPPTHVAVQAQYDHCMDMLRLCHSDNLGVRDLVPATMLRLGYDQECFDFVKWWGTTGERGRYESDQFLDLHGADAFEPCGFLEKTDVFPELGHMVVMVLLKMRLLFDICGLREASRTITGRVPTELMDQICAHVPRSPIVAAKRHRLLESSVSQLLELMEDLGRQIKTLCRLVVKANPYFWKLLLHECEEHLGTLPTTYSHGSMDQAILTREYTYRAWFETPGALDFLRQLEDTDYLEPI